MGWFRCPFSATRKINYHCGEAGNTTAIGTQLYFTSVEQRYKHGGHVVRAFWRERKTCFVLSRVVT